MDRETPAPAVPPHSFVPLADRTGRQRLRKRAGIEHSQPPLPAGVLTSRRREQNPLTVVQNGHPDQILTVRRVWKCLGAAGREHAPGERQRHYRNAPT